MILDILNNANILNGIRIGLIIFLVLVIILDLANIIFKKRSFETSIKMSSINVLLILLILVVPGMFSYGYVYDDVTSNNTKNFIFKKINYNKDKNKIEKTGIFTETDGLTYHVFVPDNATTDMPLVLYLHGDGAEGINNKFWGNAVDIYGDDVPFIVVAPEGGMWAETKGRLDVLKNIMYDVCDEYECDTDRLIITGHSRGAIGTWAMVSENPGMFYAAVPVSCFGSIYPESFATTKVWAIAGDTGEAENIYVDAMTGFVKEINDAGGNAIFTQLHSGHGATQYLAYTKEVYEWLLK